MKFNEYVQTRTLESILLESMGNSATFEDEGIIKRFVNSLSKRLPGGLGSIQGVVGKIKSAFQKLSSSNKKMTPEKLENPTNDMLVRAAKILKNGNDLKDAQWWLTVFKRELKKNGIQTTNMTEDGFFSQFANFQSKPQGTLQSLMLNPPQQAEPPQAIGVHIVTKAAEELKASSKDPAFHSAVDQALADCLSDEDLYKISHFDRRSNAGQQATTNYLQRQNYGQDKTNDDLSKELRNNSNFSNRMRRSQGKRRREKGTIKNLQSPPE